MSRSGNLTVLVLAITLGACKLARNDEQTDRDLPPPEPSAENQPTKRSELPAPTPRPREVDRPAPRPAEPSEPGARPTPRAEPPTTSEPAPAPPVAAPSATTTTETGAAGSAPTLNPNCLPKCQATLQGCISKPPALDGGLPSLESMAECRKAFDDCRKECGI
jgi:outer membrane biosynthesis protein TonB